MEFLHWREVKEILHQVMSLSPEKRHSFLDRKCGEDHRLREEVISFLDPEPRRMAFLDQPPLQLNQYDDKDFTGKQFGSYLLRKELGRGGMGVVYLAVRADDVYKKQVAVKVLKWGGDKDYLFARFLRERQILANLDHPLIAKLLDGGAAEDGRPFYVMEYVKGEPIHRYCNDRRLSIRERLELFRKVCDAVQYAHRNLVVHRDLKPGNILVNEDGEPRLLDFGIAKLLEEGRDSPPTLTVPGFRAMTPDYASPEQIRGEVVSTAADIYSLGVLLYELLTGALPVRFRSGTDPEIQQDFFNQTPRSPSFVAERALKKRPAETTNNVATYQGPDRARLPGLLKGDLDNIVLMALRHEPGRRYVSAEQFSQDIGLYLNGFPVRARSDTFRYRSVKFIKRHGYAIAGSALVFVVLVCFLILLVFQRQTIIAERDRVEREKVRMELVSEFLVDLFELSDPYQTERGTVDARLLLDKASREITDDLEKDPETRSALMSNLGRVYTNMGIVEEAAPLLNDALRVRKRLLGEHHPDVARSYSHLGDLAIIDGRYGDAEALFSKSLAIVEKKTSSEPLAGTSARLGRARALMMLARFEEAERDFLAVYRIQTGEYLGDRPELATTLHYLGEMYSRWSKLPEAEQFLRKALDMRARVYGPDHALCGRTLSDLGKTCLSQGKFSEAEELLEKALRVQEETLGMDHPGTGVTLAHLAGVYNQQGQYEKAMALMARSLNITENAQGGDNPSVAAVMINLAMINKRMARYDEAEFLYHRAIPVLRRALGPDHPNVAISLNNLAVLYLAQNRLDEAAYLIEEVLAITKRNKGPGHPQTAVFLGALAETYYLLGEADSAITLFCEAAAIDEEVFGAADPRVAGLLLHLARAYHSLNEFQQAEYHAQRAWSIQKNARVRGEELAETEAFLKEIAGEKAGE